MTRDEITQLDDDALLTEVNNRRGYYSVDFNDDFATELLESTGGDYAIYKSDGVYYVTIFGCNPINGNDYESTADTLARSACLAWLAWHDGKEAQNDIHS